MKVLASSISSKVLVLDNGGYTIKIGFTTDEQPRVIPNSITKAKNERRRQFIGNQIDDCKDFSGLYYIYPYQRGFIENWDVEKQIWDHIFSNEVCNVNFKETCLIVTEPYFNFHSLQESITEILFEDYKFHSLLRVNSGTLSAYKHDKTHAGEMCCLVVDSGFSSTHIVPYIKGKRLHNSTRRINVGGKLMTNHLKELISYRQLHVMDETYVVNQIKEDVCFVTTDLVKDMNTTIKRKENSIVRDYVLPDYTVIRRGYVRPLEETTGKPKDNEQIIRMNNERFMVPEILFHPSDINVKEMGISEAIVHCIESTPEEIRPHLYKNILLTGGNTCFPGFKDRVFNDVRCLAPFFYDVNVTLAENPITNAWKGGCAISKDPEFHKLIVTRKQYEENGLQFCLDKFEL